MANYRRGRIDDAVAQQLCVTLRELSDPRFIENLVSVTRAEVAPDLKTAKIYFSCISGDEDVAQALKGASGALRRALAKELNLRITPTLTFVKDGSMEHGARISRILSELNISHEEDGND